MGEQPRRGPSSLENNRKLFLPHFSDVVSGDCDFHFVQVEMSMERLRGERGVIAWVPGGGCREMLSTIAACGQTEDSLPPPGVDPGAPRGMVSPP